MFVLCVLILENPSHRAAMALQLDVPRRRSRRLDRRARLGGPRRARDLEALRAERVVERVRDVLSRRDRVLLALALW